MIDVKQLAVIPEKLFGKLGPVGLKLRQYSPEILLGAGIFGVVGGTALACRATLRTEEVMQQHRIDSQAVHDLIEESDPEFKKELTKVYFHTGGKIVQLYAPASAAMIVGIACIIGSHNIQSGRIAGLAAAYSTADTLFNEYRDRVRDEIGEKKELELYRNLEDGEIEVTKTTKDGKSKVTKKKVKTLDPEHRSMYTFIFDESNPEHTKDATYNKHFILSNEVQANQKFQLNGYLYLNEVLQDLGFDTKHMPWTRVVGWLKGMGDDYIDFGVFEAYDKSKCDFVNCVEPSIWLDFNVDGYIFDKLGVEAPPLSSADEEYLVYSETMKDE